MRSTTRTVMRGITGALVAVALGFGARQALAAPAVQPTAAGACLREEAGECIAECRETHGPGYIGRCTKNVFGHITCQCVPLFP